MYKLHDSVRHYFSSIIFIIYHLRKDKCNILKSDVDETNKATNTICIYQILYITFRNLQFLCI